MINDLTGLGYGLVVFGVIIGAGILVLVNFAANSGVANEDITYVRTQLGQTGLAGWIPAIIAVSIAFLFIGLFLGKGAAGKRR